MQILILQGLIFHILVFLQAESGEGLWEQLF
jgi:hypothetical protein